MTTSPWATIVDKPKIDKKTKTETDTRQPIIHPCTMDKIALWSDSEVSRQLFEMLETSPEIGTQNLLHASALFRDVNDHVLSLVHKFSETPNIQEGFFDTLNIVLNDCKNDPSVHDDLNNETSKIMADIVDQYTHDDEILCLKLYSAIMRHASYIVTNEYFHGKLPPLVLSGIADDADEAIKIIECDGDSDIALSPIDLINFDNFIQDGYKRLSVVIGTALNKFDKNCEAIQFNPAVLIGTDDASIDFKNAVLSIKSFGDTLDELSDDLNGLIASHRWPTVYENLTKTAFENLDQDNIILPEIGINEGIQEFLKDFIDFNSDLRVDTEDAMAMASALKLVADQLKTYDTPTIHKYQI